MKIEFLKNLRRISTRHLTSFTFVKICQAKSASPVLKSFVHSLVNIIMRRSVTIDNKWFIEMWLHWFFASFFSALNVACNLIFNEFLSWKSFRRWTEIDFIWVEKEKEKLWFNGKPPQDTQPRFKFLMKYFFAHLDLGSKILREFCISICQKCRGYYKWYWNVRNRKHSSFEMNAHPWNKPLSWSSSARSLKILKGFYSFENTWFISGFENVGYIFI